MNLQEALLSVREGNFVTNEYFSKDQSLHWCDGKYYYEDGAVVTEEFLSAMDFAVNGDWSVIIEAKNVDLEKLKLMHGKNRSLMLQDGSYMDCSYL